MDLQISEEHLLREAQEMALHLRLLERHAAAIPARVREETASEAEEAAENCIEDGDRAGAEALRWFAARLRSTGGAG